MKHSLISPCRQLCAPGALVAMLLLAGTNAADARQFFVAPSGNDQNNGSKNSPWQTFDRAASGLLPGDTLYLRQGTYAQELRLDRDGSAAAPIAVSNYYGERCRITNTQYQGTGIRITGSYIKVHGLEVSHWGNAMELQSDAGAGRRVSFITLDSLTVFDANYGIGVYDGGHDITLTNCQMYRFGWFGFDATAGGAFNSIYNITILNCYSHDADYTLPDHNPDGNADGFAFGHNNERDVFLQNCRAAGTGDGFDLDGHHIVVVNCVAERTTYQSGGGFKCWGDSVMLYNCLSYGHLGTGIELDQEVTPTDQFYLKPTRTFVMNCTVADNAAPNIHVQSPFKALTMYNTLLAGGPHQGRDTTNPRGLVMEDLSDPADKNYKPYSRPFAYTGDYNLFHSDVHWAYIIRNKNDSASDSFGSEAEPLTAWQALSGQDSRSKFVDTTKGMFLNYAVYDYHLTAGSPAVDAGSRDYLVYPGDLDGRARDGKPDVGCYEYSKGDRVGDYSISPALPFRCWPVEAGSGLRAAFSLPCDVGLRIAVSDVYGSTPWAIHQFFQAGEHQIDIPARGLPSGTYAVSLSSAASASTQIVRIIR